MKHKDARANRSREALINAGIQLFLKNPGASLKEVAEFAGVGRATLYRHFDTRDQLIQEIAQESLIMTDSVMVPIKQQQLSAEESIRAIFHAIMPMADRYHFLLSLWSIAGDNEEVMATYMRQLSELNELVEHARSEGFIREELSNEWIVLTIDTMIYSGWWLISEGQCTPEQAAEQAVMTLFNGVAKK